MSKLKILLVVIFSIMSVMIITAIFHMIAAYLAVLIVIWFIGWISIKILPPDKPSGDQDQ